MPAKKTPPPTYPPNLPDPRRGYLLAAHVAALFEQVDRDRGAETVLKPTTVVDAVRKSRPGGRYESRPLRQPSGYLPGQGGGLPFWQPGERETLATLEAELMAWRRGMVGRGVGGGPKPRTDRPAGGAR